VYSSLLLNFLSEIPRGFLRNETIHKHVGHYYSKKTISTTLLSTIYIGIGQNAKNNYQKLAIYLVIQIPIGIFAYD